MKSARRAFPYFALALLCYSCSEEADSSNGEPQFGHDSSRPPCEYSIDPDRQPYYQNPVVVADGWSDPVKLSGPVNTDCPEDAIEISPEGTTLYFFWSPEVNASSEVLLGITTGTYYARRVAGDPGNFGEPHFFDLQKGAEDGSVDGAPSFSLDRNLVYFHSNRADNTGYRQTPPVDDPMDIYVATITGGEPEPASNLGQPVNSIHLDGEHGLSPDGLQLYLASTRPGGLGAVDIWVSTRSGDTWSEPANLGSPINSAASDLQPAFPANDPDTMYFVSDRDGRSSIYRSTFDGTEWSQPEMLITGYVGEPGPVGDGSILYFVHVLVDDAGVYGSDVWYTERTE